MLLSLVQNAVLKSSSSSDEVLGEIGRLGLPFYSRVSVLLQCTALRLLNITRVKALARWNINFSPVIISWKNALIPLLLKSVQEEFFSHV
jgi:hypothetical protein